MSTSLGPDEIRKLRGGASRASFARQVAVTPNTVYRWELPASAKDARRPRGAELARLELLAAGPPPSGVSPPSGVPTSAVPTGAPNDTAPVHAALDRIYRADGAVAGTELLRVLAQGRSMSRDARALAASGLALLDVLLRCEPRSALATLATALADAEDGALSAHAAAYVYATAACVHSLPDATLFDAGRVHAFGARATDLSRGAFAEITFLAWMPTVHTSVAVYDDDLLGRALAKLDEPSWSELPPLLAIHELEVRALRATFAGQRGLAAKLLEEVAREAAEHGFILLEARALAMLAVRKLDELAEPEQALTLARRSQLLARSARVASGPHTLFAVRAEAEALLRLGRGDEAASALTALDAYTAETGLPAILCSPAVLRVYYLTGRHDAFPELAAKLRACAVPSLRAVCRAHAVLADALHKLALSDDPDETIAMFDRAILEARGWPFLLRDVLLFSATAHLVGDSEPKARVALRRAQRMLDRFPSPAASAFLQRVEGTLLARHGQRVRGKQLMLASVGTYESAGDLADAALGRHMVAMIADAFHEAGADALLKTTTAAVASYGLKLPAGFRVGLTQAVRDQDHGASGTPWGQELERLVAPLHRLAMHGAEPALVQRELVAVAADLLGGKLTLLAEIDSLGQARTLGASNQEAAAVAPGEAAFEGVELGDGSGRRLRLSAQGPLGDEGRAILGLVATVGGLALEAAMLRSAGLARPAPAPTGDDEVEIPALIAVSPSMRALRSEIVHLAGSRATVVIQGESGSGKEIVARAIHDLSARATKPYVAFNCATVPRDLFEAQLFGYRRGAFTGATADHPGMLRAADGGTIFLDEIGELPLDVQPKLLRFLENGEVFPLGDKRPQTVDVRVVTATHRDLAALVRDKRFREDLYYRLQVIVLRIAPLRDRREDIAPLARHFLNHLAGPEGPAVLTPEALGKLGRYDWPGNVRELRNVLERALAYTPRPRVLHPDQIKLEAP